MVSNRKNVSITLMFGFALGCILAPEATASAQYCAVKGPRENGEACWVDTDCKSAECKGFKCTKRERPILKKGKYCKLDQDCCSNKCTLFRCE